MCLGTQYRSVSQLWLDTGQMRVSVDENMAEEENRQPRGGSDVGWHFAGGSPMSISKEWKM